MLYSFLDKPKTCASFLLILPLWLFQKVIESSISGFDISAARKRVYHTAFLNRNVHSSHWGNLLNIDSEKDLWNGSWDPGILALLIHGLHFEG